MAGLQGWVDSMGGRPWAHAPSHLNPSCALRTASAVFHPPTSRPPTALASHTAHLAFQRLLQSPPPLPPSSSTPPMWAPLWSTPSSCALRTSPPHASPKPAPASSAPSPGYRRAPGGCSKGGVQECDGTGKSELSSALPFTRCTVTNPTTGCPLQVHGQRHRLYGRRQADPCLQYPATLHACGQRTHAGVGGCHRPHQRRQHRCPTARRALPGGEHGGAALTDCWMAWLWYAGPFNNSCVGAASARCSHRSIPIMLLPAAAPSGSPQRSASSQSGFPTIHQSQYTF